MVDIFLSIRARDMHEPIKLRTTPDRQKCSTTIERIDNVFRRYFLGKQEFF